MRDTGSEKGAEPHVVWHQHAIGREDRQRLLGQRGCVVWFTGLSGCGKSTIANAVDGLLYVRRAASFLLDGDNIRHGLCAGPGLLQTEHGESFAQRFGLGFGAADREENIRRVGAVADLFAASGLITLVAFVSPYRRDRDRVRAQVERNGGPGSFVEIFVDTPLEECERRDPKGLYQKARRGEIANFTGISDPYEAPQNPELHLQTAGASPEQLAQRVVEYLSQQEIFLRERGPS